MSKVSVVETNPKSVISDYSRLMKLADYKKELHPSNKTILKLNIPWSLFFPAISTNPWQLEGTLKVLREGGYNSILAVENQTVVSHPWKGAYANKWLPVLKKYGAEFQPLTDVEWTRYEPKAEMLAMEDIFGEVLIPKIFLGSNIVHMPTVKTHGLTITTGAMKNAFGGLIPKYRHHAHVRIHEILVDLLAIQKEIHKGLFAVMDGSVCGNGAGPKTVDPFIGNIILASNDQVSIDAVAAKIMGFDPWKIGYIKIAHDRGLGIGDLDQIDIVGISRKEFNTLNFGFKIKRNPVVLGDHFLRNTSLRMPWLHHMLFRSAMFKIFVRGSEFYHDSLWYPAVGKEKINEFMKTEWGKLFQSYDYGVPPKYENLKEWDSY